MCSLLNTKVRHVFQIHLEPSRGTRQDDPQKFRKHFPITAEFKGQHCANDIQDIVIWLWLFMLGNAEFNELNNELSRVLYGSDTIFISAIILQT